MRQITEVTIYTNGPANVYKTWSNAPYFFTKAVRERGIKVNLVNIHPYPFIGWIYNRTIRLGWKLIHWHTTYAYFRSGLHHWIASFLINKAVKKYPDSQVDIFLTFSFSSEKRPSRQIVLLSDWPYSYSIKYFRGRPPDRFELNSIAREDAHIEDADLIISLFQSSVDFMLQNYRNNKIYCLGQAINVPPELLSESESLPEIKRNSFNLLFIGDAKYTAGLQVLLKAYELLKPSYPLLTLTIIGNDTSLPEPLPDGVKSYGYLDKGQEESRSLFYSLLKQARIYINSTPKWGGYSSILEAMAFYTPVVVAPFHEIVRVFGEQNEFIVFCEENSPQILAKRIRTLLEHPDYPTLARQSHEAVKNFTWDHYIDRFLNLIETNL